MPDTSMTVHRETIYALAFRYRLPTIYGFRFYVTGGGLMSYGVDAADLLAAPRPMSTAYCEVRGRTNFQFNCRRSSS